MSSAGQIDDARWCEFGETRAGELRFEWARAKQWSSWQLELWRLEDRILVDKPAQDRANNEEAFDAASVLSEAGKPPDAGRSRMSSLFGALALKTADVDWTPGWMTQGLCGASEMRRWSYILPAAANCRELPYGKDDGRYFSLHLIMHD